MNLGDRQPSRRRLPPGFRIDRVVAGFAYARNGNAYRPTPKFRWEVFHGDSYVGLRYTERLAVELASEHAKTLVVVLGGQS